MNVTHEQNRPSWCAVDPESMVWANWGEGQVVYHRPSGRTHFLNDVSRRLIVDVLPAPGGPGRDAGSVAAALDIPADDLDVEEMVEEIHDLLMHLEALGLVERVARSMTEHA